MKKINLTTITLHFTNNKTREIRLSLNENTLFDTQKYRLIGEVCNILYKKYMDISNEMDIEIDIDFFNRQWCDIKPEILFAINEYISQKI